LKIGIYLKFDDCLKGSMEQHPVPQNIASYQFRLVGDMTLKQFAELAGGVIIAYIIFSLPVAPVIKWPFIVLFAFLGFALAFLPIQERPLDIWIKNFVVAITSPTRYLWRKNNQPPAILTKKTKQTVKKNQQAPTQQKALQQYLASLPSSQPPTASLDQNEQQRLKNIGNLLHQLDFQPQPEPEPKPISQPQPKTLPEKEKQPASNQIHSGSRVKPAPPITPPLKVQTTKKIKQELTPEVIAMFSEEMAMPSKPNTANVIVGMVTDPNNRILPNSLIEIKDEKEETVRALKTNKLGQFYSAAPLKNGQYKIYIEHPGYNFDIIKLKVENKIIPPIKIKAST